MSRNVWNCGLAFRSGDSNAAIVVGRFRTTFPRYTRFCVSVDMYFTTSHAALESPDLKASPQFQTFLDIYANPASTYKGTTLVGSEDVNIFQAFLEKWQTGQVTDVHGGLEDTASQIDAVVAQG